jgi:RNA polymerase sigma-70 factor (ECF subfamily)
MSKTPVLREAATEVSEVSDASVNSLDDARRRQRITELSRLHRAYLEALARKLCRGLLEPDDLVQDLFEKTMRTVERIPEGVNERAWLSRVLHNLFIDKLRRRTARREEPLDQPPEPEVEETTWWHRVTAEDIRAMLVQLPDEQRVTFELFAFEGRTYEDIAAALGIAKATVGTRILRARLRLRELLTKERRDG